MAPTTTRTRLTDQEKMKICEEKKKPGLTRLENKVLKEQLVAKDTKKKQKSINVSY